jgi:hypothetical protein
MTSQKATPILTDNQSCMKLASNLVMHSRIKHISIQYHFIRELVQAGDINIIYVPTAYQQADFLTKPLSHKSFLANRVGTGIKPLPN